jgi:hypothetical protein
MEMPMTTKSTTTTAATAMMTQYYFRVNPTRSSEVEDINGMDMLPLGG